MRHHPADLTVAALLQTDGQPGVLAPARVQPGLDRRIAHPVHGHTLCQGGERRRLDRAMHTHAITAEPAGGRQFQRPRQGAVIGQQQQPLAGQIETADADHPRQLLAQLVEHRGPALRIAVRRHQPLGLVIAPEPCGIGRVHEFAVHGDEIARRHEGRGMRDRDVVEADLAFHQQTLGVAAAGDPGAGEVFGDPVAARFFGVRHDRHAAINASNRRRSPGSMRNSGCHCTPRQKRYRESSTPSITASGARALTMAWGPGSRTA